MRRAVGVALHGDRGHVDDRTCRKPLLDIVVFTLAVREALPPAIVVDDNGNMVRIVEGGSGAIERRVVEFPLRRSELPDELVEVMPVLVVAVAAAVGRKIELVPPLEFC